SSVPNQREKGGHMRGKWALAAAAVLALVVVGGVGGLTMRAFAGTARTTVTKTKIVTKLCVYVDRTNGGDSYPHVSVKPKYSHKICIAGKRGPAGANGLAGPSGPAVPAGPSGPPGAAGNTSIITWNKTVATPIGLPLRRGGPPPGTTLATAGPFTIIG